MSLPRANRLNLRLERDRVTKTGKTLRSRHFTVVIATPSSDSHSRPDRESIRISSSPRLGILVSKKTAKLAVDRNRLRRRVSSLLEKLLPGLPAADYLIIPRSSVLDLPFSELTSDITGLLTS